MFKSAYPFTLISAILLSAILLTSCGGGTKRDTVHISSVKDDKLKAQEEANRLAEKDAAYAQAVEDLVSQARLDNPETTALEQLLAMSQDPTLSSQNRGLAAFKYAELLFEFDRPDAFTIAQQTVAKWKNHPYLPQFHTQVAYQWVALENYQAAMKALTLALHQPLIAPYTLSDNMELAGDLLVDIPLETRLDWMLAVSMHDVQNRDDWLQQSAMIAPLAYVLQLRHSEYALTIEQASFYRYFAQQHLMMGDYRTVRLTAKILENDMPNSDVYPIVKAWSEGEGSRVTIGVLLPLSGKYANYGQQVLNGIRLAISRPEFKGKVTLYIQDTAADAEQCVLAYQTLLNQGVEWVIGPLLSSNTQALIPFLIETTPLIALSNKTQLAAESPALFIHSLAKVVQADFMARHALEEGHKNIVILHGYTDSALEEAAVFAQTFIDAGGEILDIVELKKSFHDNRPDLMGMRFRTDDEELLAELDEDLFLFSAEQNMDIKMPLAFDALYIIEKGSKVTVLVGQLAYSNIRAMQLYGSHRWDDGHLLDDSGRYLDGAQFATPFTNTQRPNQEVSDLKSQYRIIWNKDNMSPLFALAYDTAMNISTLGSRLGLKGEHAMTALKTTLEFPAISGHYYFDEDGVSKKDFAIQRIHRGQIE
ncbi:MAG: penicillin-binding protein activator [Ghiorsea sp.]|nr:penicillin-binding protein activator [Ghiorsea sp.]